MKYFFIVFLFYSNFLLGIELISLGGSCVPAGVMRDLGVRKAAYPFDWMFSSWQSIIQSFEDDFEHFLDPESLQVASDERVVIDYYGLQFVHDFPTIYSGPALQEGQTHEWAKIRHDWKNFIDPIRKKYLRRIDRLKKVLSSQDKVYLIRYNLYPLNKEEIVYFCECIKTNYPKLDFTLIIVVHTNSALEPLNLPDIKQVYIPHKEPGMWKGWRALFISLGVHLTKLVSDKLVGDGCFNCFKCFHSELL